MHLSFEMKSFLSLKTLSEQVLFFFFFLLAKAANITSAVSRNLLWWFERRRGGEGVEEEEGGTGEQVQNYYAADGVLVLSRGHGTSQAWER